MQEQQVGDIIQRIQNHASDLANKRVEKKAWGAPMPTPTQARRSFTSPLHSPTLRAHKTVLTDHVTSRFPGQQLPPHALLAPDHAEAPPPRPSSANRARPSSAARRQPAAPVPVALPGAGGSGGSILSRPRASLTGASGTTGKPVAQLEAEIGDLRHTIDLLLAARSAKQPPKSQPGQRPSSAVDARAGGVAAANAGPWTSSVDSRAARIMAEHHGNMVALGSVLEERAESEARSVALERESRAVAKRVARDGQALALSPPPQRREARGSFESKEMDEQELQQQQQQQGDGTGAWVESVRRAYIPGDAGRRSSSGANEGYGDEQQQYGDNGEGSDGRPQLALPPPHPRRRSSAGAPSFLSRPTSAANSISKRRMDEEMARRRAEEEALLSFRFKAGPVPDSTRLPLFKQLMQQAATKRELKHEARSEELAQKLKPFAGLQANEEQMRARVAGAKARAELQRQRELVEGRNFRAHPVPPTTQTADPEYAALLKREKERPERLSSTARALLSSAALPPRMSLAEQEEKRRRAQREAANAAEEALQRRRQAFRANSLPDFPGLQASFTQSLTKARATGYVPTTPRPFGFDTEERRQADAEKRAAFRRPHDLAGSLSFALRATSAEPGQRGGGRPGSAAGAWGLNTSASAFATTPQRRGSAAPAGSVLNVSARLAQSTAPPAGMTRAVELRMKKTQEALRSAHAEELEKAREEEERKAKVHEATRLVAAVVKQRESERKSAPLAWEMDAVAKSASAARQEFERSSRERAAYNASRIAAAQESRPLIMDRHSIEANKVRARREALVDVAKSVAASQVGRVAWQEVADTGVAGVAVFDDDDRELMAVTPAGE